MNTSYDTICAALQTLHEVLPAWTNYVAQRQAVEEVIASLERCAAAPEAEENLPWEARNLGLSRQERRALLKQVQESRAKRLAELREQQRHHEEIIAKLAPAVRTICRFAHRAGIDADPLRRLFDLHELEVIGQVRLVLLQIVDALDKQPPEQLPPEGARFAEEDVPAQFREGGKPDGAVLTAPYLVDSTNWLLKGPNLTKHYGRGKELTTHIKVGRAKAYLISRTACSTRPPDRQGKISGWQTFPLLENFAFTSR